MMDLEKIRKQNEIKDLQRIRRVGKYTSIISFLLILFVFFSTFILYLLTGNPVLEKGINIFLDFMDRFQWWWITLSSFVGVNSIVKLTKGESLVSSVTGFFKKKDEPNNIFK